jgi:hypothetical protein
MRTRNGLAAGLLALACGGCGGSGGGGRDPGTLFFSQDGNANGLFVLDTSTGLATLVGLGETDTTGSTIGLTETDDATLLVGSTFSDLVLIQADGSGAADLGPPTVAAEGLAFHTSDGLLYTIINQDFRTVDPATGTILTTLASPPVDIEGLASDYGSNIFGLGDSVDLYVYDVTADSWSVIGSTGIAWDKGVGLAYDPDEDVLYAVGATGGGENLYRIDPGTGTTTLVGPTGLVGTRGGLGFVRGD